MAGLWAALAARTRLGWAIVTHAKSDLGAHDAFLTSHVLDLARGRPGAGVPVEVWVPDDAAGACVAKAVSNDNGRFEQPLLRRPDAQSGAYRLDFGVGALAGPETGGFLNSVSIDVHLANPDCHYHVPLIVAPWGYTTYRGAPPAHAPLATPPVYHADADHGDDTPPAKPPPAIGDPAVGVTTHVIDLARGVGAGNLRIDVTASKDGGQVGRAKSHRTTAEGRTVAWLVDPPDFEPGAYDLTFHIGDYYRAASTWDEPPFFPQARVRFHVGAPLSHHHIPLLIAPWGYSVYRGS